MTACLWTDIDTYLVAAITADMGAASGYTTLKIGSVVVADLINFDASNLTYPVAVVTGMTCESQDDTHAGGPQKSFQSYAYIIKVVAKDSTPALAKQAAQELGRRLRLMLQATARYALGGLTATDGEHVNRCEVSQQMQLEVVGPGGGRNYEGIVYATCTIHTEY